MKMTTRDVAGLSSFENVDPAADCQPTELPEAPDWFRQARGRADKGGPGCRRPVDFPNLLFMTFSDKSGRWRQRLNNLGFGVVAVSIAFVMGYCWRGPTASVPSNSAITAHRRATTQVNDERSQESMSEQAVVVEQQPPTRAGNPDGVDRGSPQSKPALTDQWPVTLDRSPPETSAIVDAKSQEIHRVEVKPVPSVNESIDGFLLQPRVAGNLIAEVQIPENSWFSLASAKSDCDSGTCKLVPVRQADRKLNTAMEWMPTPELAAEKAAREGKLVFLIHVSGNFAQPGFT